MNEFPAPPRPVRLRPSAFVAGFTIFALALGAPAAELAAYIYSVAVDRILDSRGVIVKGLVLDKEITTAKGGAHGYRIDFEFSPPGSPTLVNKSDWVPRSEFDWLQKDGPVDIQFDPLDPTLAEVGYADRAAFRSSRAKNQLIGVPILLPFFFMIALQLVYPVLRRRQLLRWGVVVQGRILGARAERQRRSGSVAILIFRFRDAKGVEIQGRLRENLRFLEGRNSLDHDVAALWREPLVLFDARDSSRNMLYTPHPMLEVTWLSPTKDLSRLE